MSESGESIRHTHREQREEERGGKNGMDVSGSIYPPPLLFIRFPLFPSY